MDRRGRRRFLKEVALAIHPGDVHVPGRHLGRIGAQRGADVDDSRSLVARLGKGGRQRRKHRATAREQHVHDPRLDMSDDQRNRHADILLA
jgi:hypothetical protein